MSWADLIGRVGQARNGHQRAGELFSNARNNDSNVLPPQDQSYNHQSYNPDAAKDIKSAGEQKLNKDKESYEPRNFPPGYYEEFAQALYDDAVKRNGDDPGKAFEELFQQINSGETQDPPPNFPLTGKDRGADRTLENLYHEALGVKEDEIHPNGFDKVLHYLTSAYLAYTEGAGSAYSKGVLAEVTDEVKSRAWWGKEREGWSRDDMEANKRGIDFAERIKGTQYPPTGTTNHPNQ